MMRPDSSNIPAVILSGGSEIVSLALAESLVAARIPLVVIGLGIHSMLWDVQPGLVYRSLDWPPVSGEQARDQLLAILREIGAGQPQPWPVFATEDGGLRLLMTHRRELSSLLAMGGAGDLVTGGLDKAELFTTLSRGSCGPWLAPSIVLEHPDEVVAAFLAFGDGWICKPALKPLDMRTPGMSAKILAPLAGESREQLHQRLEFVWPLSRRWVVQQRLHTPEQGEGLWWGLRLRDGSIRGCTAYERWKQPRIGGSGCWVELVDIPELHGMARGILEKLDFQGIAELPFLQDADGNWRLLELNPRPWLQLALPERAGHGWVVSWYRNLLDQVVPPGLSRSAQACRWVNAERLLLAALSGEHGARPLALGKALGALARSQVRVGYDSPLRGVRRRWLGRMATRLITGSRLKDRRER